MAGLWTQTIVMSNQDEEVESGVRVRSVMNFIVQGKDSHMPFI